MAQSQNLFTTVTAEGPLHSGVELGHGNSPRAVAVTEFDTGMKRAFCGDRGEKILGLRHDGLLAFSARWACSATSPTIRASHGSRRDH